MNIAICDDKSIDRNAIINQIHLYDSCFVKPKITQYNDAEALLQAYSKGARYDVLFLDVEMNQTNGIEAGIQIREKQPDISIVFISSYPQYAIPAYDCNPLYFITKPIDPERFYTIFTKVIEKHRTLVQLCYLALCASWLPIITGIYFVALSMLVIVLLPAPHCCMLFPLL
ncbi:MAG: response regulator transcription factor [Clostridia bacterium]|nr:response regulator transcription factor [Clostridia bacterium]